MSQLTNDQVIVINTKDDVDSYPHRTNYANIQAAVNDNYTRITNTLSPGPSEVTDARDNMSSLQENIRLRKNTGDRINGANDLQVVENSGGATNNVQIGTGSGIVNGVGVENTSTATSSTISPSAAGNHKRVVFVIASDNTLSTLEGAEVLTSATPPYPAISDSQMALAYTIVDSAAVVISDADIIDERLPALNIFEGLNTFSASATYDSSNRLDELIYTDKSGNEYTFSHTYTNDNLTEIELTYLTYTVTTTLTYDSSNNVASQETILDV